MNARFKSFSYSSFHLPQRRGGILRSDDAFQTLNTIY
nr:MAG TPA: hypothetical protein [Caudoviricetes sp.]